MLTSKRRFKPTLGNQKNLVNRYTPYALLRLLLDRVSIIPDKVLYLDTDTVINKSITGLYNTDIAQYEYAAVKDRYGRFFFNPFYCNTGVLLLNMAMIRKTNLFKKVVDLLNTKKVFLSDQTGINKMTKRKKYYLVNSMSKKMSVRILSFATSACSFASFLNSILSI